MNDSYYLEPHFDEMRRIFKREREEIQGKRNFFRHRREKG